MMIDLTREDWVEIYGALDSKRMRVEDNQVWAAHLQEIMDKIGPDGENMIIDESNPDSGAGVARFYLLFVWDDVEPQLLGPYNTHLERDAMAKKMRENEGPEHGAYRINITSGAHIGVYEYSGAFFELDD